MVPVIGQGLGSSLKFKKPKKSIEGGGVGKKKKSNGGKTMTTTPRQFIEWDPHVDQTGTISISNCHKKKVSGVPKTKTNKPKGYCK